MIEEALASNPALRPKLWGMSYRITGSHADAEEVVQEALTRALTARPLITAELPLEPWLMKVTVNLSLDYLRIRKAHAYAGPWLPSPILTDGEAEEPITLAGEAQACDRYELLESVTCAFLLALEVLTPKQRAVLVLRDVFELPARQVAGLIDESEEAVRALHHRARVALEQYNAERCVPNRATRQRTEQVLSELFRAIAADDAPAALRLLANDAVAISDSAGVYRAAQRIVAGRTDVYRLLAGILRKSKTPTQVRLIYVNGLPALDVQYDPQNIRSAPRIIAGIWLNSAQEIAGVYMTLAPDKLAHLA